jgi:hypothetical protein
MNEPTLNSLIISAQHLYAREPGLHWYALADAAQHPGVPEAIGDEVNSASLLGATWDTPLGRQSPWLVALAEPTPHHPPWQWLEQTMPRHPSVATVLASRLQPAEQLAHLRQCLDLKLPDGDDMVLAYWDPVILGALVGQAGDETLHVKGPILNAIQRQALLHSTVAWWYFDRDGHLQTHRPESDAAAMDADGDRARAWPLQLDQHQLDQLVEASVPDQVLYHLQTNQPLLLDDVAPRQRYRCVRDWIRLAREHGLETFRDLCNFCCAGLIYGHRMTQDPVIQGLLARLKAGQANWDALVAEFPE